MSWTRRMAIEPSAADEIAQLPRTIALLPFFVSGRFSKPDLLGRCEGDRIVPISGRETDRARARDWSRPAGSRAAAGPAGGAALRKPAGLAPHRLRNPGVRRRDSADLSDAGRRTSRIHPRATAKPRLTVVSTVTQLDKVIASSPSLPALQIVVAAHLTETEAAGGPAAQQLEDPHARGGGRAGPSDDQAGLGAGEEFHDKAKHVLPEDLATIIYTSGTTGEPKGVMLTHANLAANMKAPQVFDVGEDDTALSFLPLCHGFERMVAYIVPCERRIDDFRRVHRHDRATPAAGPTDDDVRRARAYTRRSARRQRPRLRSKAGRARSSSSGRAGSPRSAAPSCPKAGASRSGSRLSPRWPNGSCIARSATGSAGACDSPSRVVRHSARLLAGGSTASAFRFSRAMG